jgi:hypothetical protein
VRNIYNNDTITTNLTEATKVEYIVSLFKWRSPLFSGEDFIYTRLNYTGSISKTLVTTHSPELSGNFSLTIGGLDLGDILFNATDAIL